MNCTSLFASSSLRPSAPSGILLPARTRLGSVPYLNALPLTCAIRSPLVKLEPSALATELRAGRLDIALVPLAEVLTAPPGTYRVVEGVAIGAEQEVFSVYLNTSVPQEKIRTVALDPASRTSALLAKIVLETFLRLRPRYVSPDAPADAHLLIGDPAILHRQQHPEQTYLDLATAWRDATGLPFVFAVWAIRPRFLQARWLARKLRQAKALGLAQRPRLAKNAFELEYLTRHLCYELGPEQKKAIARFAELLVERGEIPSAPSLTYL